MKTLRLISTFIMLGLATTVTVGSMYVAVNAAAQQDTTEVTVNPQAISSAVDAAGL